MRQAYIAAYDGLPDWIYAEAIHSARIEIAVHLIAFLVFVAESFALPFVAMWRFAVFVYGVLMPFRRMQQFVHGDDATLGFEMQSGCALLMVGLLAQFDQYRTVHVVHLDVTPGPDWAWAIAAFVIGIWQLIAIRHGAENRAAAMVFGLSYWCALAIILPLWSFPHALLLPASVAYFLCILRLLRRADGHA